MFLLDLASPLPAGGPLVRLPLVCVQEDAGAAAVTAPARDAPKTGTGLQGVLRFDNGEGVCGLPVPFAAALHTCIWIRSMPRCGCACLGAWLRLCCRDA